MRNLHLSSSRGARRSWSRWALLAAWLLVPGAAGPVFAQADVPEIGTLEGPDLLPPWLEGGLTVSTGFEFSSGSYGQPVDTDIWYVPFSLAYLLDDFALTPWDFDLFELRVTIPYIRIDGPAVVVGGDGQIVGGGDPLDRGLEHGLGDIVIQGNYILFPPEPGWLPAFELRTRVKIPTASRKKLLGTGEPDVTLEIDAFDRFGPVTPFVAAGRRVIGDPLGIDLRDAWFTSAGFVYDVTERWRGGLVYDWRQAVSRTAEPAHELYPFVMFRARPQLQIGPYAVIGLTQGGPDYGVGLQIRVSLDLR